LGRHIGDVATGVGADNGVLEAGEKEQLVVPDGSADHSAKLVSLEAVSAGCEEVAGVELIIADKLEEIAVESVAALLGDGVDCCGGVIAILGRQRACLDLELL